MGETPKKYGLGDVTRQYSEKLSAWLKAREDRDEYLMAINSSEPRLRRIDQFTHQLASLVPNDARIIDLGFGPEGRDMVDLIRLSNGKRLHIYGLEPVNANIRSAIQGSSILAGRVIQGDVTQMPLATGVFDAIILSSVIQHIPQEVFFQQVVPEITDVLRPGGILQIIFKSTDDNKKVLTIKDPTLGGNERSFYVYKAKDVLERFEAFGLRLYPGDEQHFGGVLQWEDQQRGIPCSGMYLVKT